MPTPRRPRYGLVAIGGTFDVFHKGHEQLVLTAFQLGQKVIIGITSDKYVKKQGKKHPVQAYASRVKAIRIFLRKKRLSSRALLVKLQDPYGPTATKPNVDTLVITPDTARSASKLNKLRRRKGLRPLRIHIVRLLRAEDGKPISSTRIRRREINRDGTLLKR